MKKSWFERALAKSVKVGGCLIYKGSLNHKGYGLIKNDGKMQSIHRLSYGCFNEEIPEGLLVRHTCDVRNCWNPEHLEIGTYQDNMDDMVKRGRSDNQEGILNSNSKLTEAQVKEIKELLETNLTQKEIASKYSVSQAHISSIKLNKMWKHLK